MYKDYPALEKSLAFEQVAEKLSRLIFVNILRSNPSNTFARWKFRAEVTYNRLIFCDFITLITVSRLAKEHIDSHKNNTGSKEHRVTN